MLIVRVLAAAAKPALVSGAVIAAAAGGWYAFDQVRDDAPQTAFRQVQDDGSRLLISEFGANADAIVAVDPADPSNRTEIARIDHAPDYGIFAALSPDGEAIAYTALPPDTARPSPDSPAQAAVVDVDGNVTVLASDVDLLVTPVWSPDNASLLVRKNTPCAAPEPCTEGGAGSFELLRLGRDGTRALVTAWRSAAVFPIAFSPDGAKVYFATLNADGTDLYSVAPDGSSEALLAHLSDDVARDWKLSPDGASIAYSVSIGGTHPEVVTRRIDLVTAAVSDAIAGGALEAGPPSPAVGVARAEFNPAWRPDGALSVGAVNLDGGADALAIDAAGVSEAVTTSGDALDLPLAWSPDGTTLALREVEGRTPFEAGASEIVVVDESGGRATVSDSADVEIVGWME